MSELKTTLTDLIAERAQDVVAAARNSGTTIATVETVTGGSLAAAVTAAPGASAVFDRGFIFYHTEAKARGLGIEESLWAENGAVSAPVTEAYSRQLVDHSDAVIGVAITGYAGPGGGSRDNPVGTVFIARFQRPHHTSVQRHVFTGDRDTVRRLAVAQALDDLADLVSKAGSDKERRPR
ncbi:CinA family protein [Corynebacterium sp. CNJ-954]|uniref:CinA family protein n=1 Tax=Corynebacterium sp. CNJ-954 TaxID=1904962 RepID=UPI0009FB32AC|nr:CinA family protein [Corynebacterium sp. CNJ-954]